MYIRKWSVEGITNIGPVFGMSMVLYFLVQIFLMFNSSNITLRERTEPLLEGFKDFLKLFTLNN